MRIVAILRYAATVTAGIALLVARASAREAGAAAPDGSSADHQARELFQKAEMSFNLGRFSEALADYQAAYEARPLPALLFNVAQCYRNLMDPERARFFYRRYLALDPRTTNRRLVEDLITEMTHRLDSQAGARSSSAAAPAATTVGTARTAPPAAPTAHLAAATDAPGVAGRPAPALALDRAAAPVTVAKGRPIYRRWWFWTGVGMVVAAAVIGGILAARSDGSPEGSLPTIDTR